jgi:hypothetical protein
LEPTFNPDTARNRLLLRLISLPEPDRGDTKGGTYLPYRSHPAYDRFANDIASVLELKLPEHDAYYHLQPLIAFHLYLYAIETANYWVGKNGIPTIVCEIVADRPDLVRKASVNSYSQNDALGVRALHVLIKQLLSDPDIEEKLQSADLDNEAKTEVLFQHLAAKCSLKRAKVRASNPEEFRTEFTLFSEKLYQDGTGEGVKGLAKASGLASPRGTTRHRYAPTDRLLQALVLANVKQPIEEGAFLRLLFEKYSLVIGPVEASQVVNSYLYDDTDFKRNLERFTQHLLGMGFAHRMSDSCTYVENPTSPEL